METNEQMLYSANDVAPAFRVHPGEILGEELAARGISGKEFAQMTGMRKNPAKCASRNAAARLDAQKCMKMRI